ncbi:MAG: hypothetical protein IKE37_08725, partial [Firmicutes bacterium]|nr:hypothetical protein [Bacillota bacterium]
EAATPDDLIERVHTGFRLGGHKAAAIGMVLKRAKIFMVSEMADELVREAFMEPFGSLQEAFDKALEEKGPGARVVIMPTGDRLCRGSRIHWDDPRRKDGRRRPESACCGCFGRKTGERPAALIKLLKPQISPCNASMVS